MKRFVWATALVTVLSLASAQGVYIGAAATNPSANAGGNFGLSLQLGLTLFPSFDIRATADTTTSFSGVSLASASALYSIPLPSSRLYLGAGADAFFAGDSVEFTSGTNYGAHALAGAEFRVGPLGAFGEAQPGITTDLETRYFRLRGGVNLHF